MSVSPVSGASLSICVFQRKAGPSSSKATSVVNNFMVEAGRIARSGFCTIRAASRLLALTGNTMMPTALLGTPAFCRLRMNFSGKTDCAVASKLTSKQLRHVITDAIVALRKNRRRVEKSMENSRKNRRKIDENRRKKLTATSKSGMEFSDNININEL